ncbi:MAG TPA: glutamate synthase [Pseudomonas sp.]|nr:glutamate synthase [Pseudomonas sp.]
MASLALHVGNQTEAAVILELFRTKQTCSHRHSTS